MATFYCLFEQSGTFKNAFKKLGHEAFDFDIQNEYGETDCVCDLFDSDIIQDIVNRAVENHVTVIMFFPCTYFSTQQILWTKGCNYAQRDWTIREKIAKSSNNIESTFKFYRIFCTWVELCVEHNLPLIIENPYNPQSFLVRYFPIKPSIIDTDRRRLGDKFQKPTMWYFINIKPNDNLIMLNPCLFDEENFVAHTKYGKERSEISSDYATNFIKSFVL